jgi:hypothetical protein
LIEVHEYEGPAALDVWVVDGDGLPVAGVPFFYYAGAPEIGTTYEAAADEWYQQGVIKVTGPDGRISFDAGDGSCAPGSCRGAVWPMGKEDVLENLGMLDGTLNRHLNGMWLLAEGGTFPRVPPPELSMPEAAFEPPVSAPGPSRPDGRSDEPDGPPPPPAPARANWRLLNEKLERIEELVAKLIAK